MVPAITHVDLDREVVSLQSQNIFDEDVPRLAAEILEHTKLTELDLGLNNISNEGIASLVDALIASTALARLDLGRNRIGDEGAARLANALTTSTALTRLDLSFNEIGDNGAASLARALVASTSLTRLSLSYNPISPEGAARMAEILRHNYSLTMIQMFGINDESGFERTIRVAKFLGTLVLLNLGLERYCPRASTEYIPSIEPLRGVAILGELAKQIESNEAKKESSLFYLLAMNLQEELQPDFSDSST